MQHLDQLVFQQYKLLWVEQVQYKQVFGARTHLGNGGGWTAIRWGFAWNNEGDFTSNDVCGGIGMYFGHPYASAYYSAGDKVGCCQNSTGLNRAMRVELYGR